MPPGCKAHKRSRLLHSSLHSAHRLNSHLQVVNVTPRYAKLRDGSRAVFGWENLELISDRPFETMLAELKRLKQEYPDRWGAVVEGCGGRVWLTNPVLVTEEAAVHIIMLLHANASACAAAACHHVMMHVPALPLPRILIASIMEEYNKAAWEEIIERCEEVGVDAFEINFR